MIGAIIGDIVGSRFEWDNYRAKDFEFMTEDCFPTDDSVMTISLAKALMESGYGRVDESELGATADGTSVTDSAGGTDTAAADNDTVGTASVDTDLVSENAIRYMRQIGQRYPDCGYGGRFWGWMFDLDPQPYNSYGNGSAMRVSAAGFAARSIDEAKALAKAVTEVTHNHPEGIKGAEATAVAIYLARAGKTQSEIEDYINEHYYDIDFTLDDIRDDYRFNESCQGTVPQALEAFFEATDYEDAIRNAISIGGDSDTMAAITGGIAEAYFGVPDKYFNAVEYFLDDDLWGIVKEWYGR
ncbi:MAG: ADP-ribosylglycohydrolase family protein [Clostridia bacterium]|nr:ADP-ribosylglycohydrolase family protein [Clostridia bacterium]